MLDFKTEYADRSRAFLTGLLLGSQVFGICLFPAGKDQAATYTHTLPEAKLASNMKLVFERDGSLLRALLEVRC